MADVFRGLDDATRRLLLDDLAKHDGRMLFDLCTMLAAIHGVALTCRRSRSPWP